MRASHRVTLSLLAATAVNAAAVPATLGGVFLNVSYDDDLFIEQGFPLQGTGVFLSGNTLPVQQTNPVRLSPSTASATYAFTDNGTTASLLINCQATLPNPQSEAVETSDQISPDVFTFTEPVRCVATFADTGYSETQVRFTSADPSVGFYFTGSGTMTHSGVLPAGVPVSLIEDWELYDTTGIEPGLVNASGSLSIVFTPVPEPASAGGLAVAGAAVLARRRGHRRLKSRAV